MYTWILSCLHARMFICSYVHTLACLYIPMFLCFNLMITCLDVQLLACSHVQMLTCSHAWILSCSHVHMLICSHILIRWTPFIYYPVTIYEGQLWLCRLGVPNLLPSYTLILDLVWQEDLYGVIFLSPRPKTKW